MALDYGRSGLAVFPVAVWRVPQVDTVGDDSDREEHFHCAKDRNFGTN